MHSIEIKILIFFSCGININKKKLINFKYFKDLYI